MVTKAYAFLRIMSDASTPDQISALLGLQLDRSWRKGDRRARTQIVEKEHGWELGSGLAQDAPLSEQLKTLLRRAKPAATQIAALSESHLVQVSCIEYTENVPSVFLSREDIQAVAELGASVDFDLYVAEANWESES